MAYEGHDWQNDEVITADLLNAMEVGIEECNSNDITSVAVNTLNAGESATASVSGGVLTLGIPKGEKGDTGAAGAAGAAGLGVKTITLTTDSTGKVTSGKWTDTADGQHDITVSAAEA